MTFRKKILTGFIACTLILAGVAIFSFKQSKKIIASNDLVDHTNQVLHEFEQILTSSVDAETGVRGFVITGDSNFLEPFLAANIKIFEHINKAKELTKDNPSQQKSMEELEKEVNMRLNNLDNVIGLRNQGFEKGREFVASGEGKRIQDQIRKIIDKTEETERILLVERKKASNEDAATFNLVFAFLLLIIIFILFIVYRIITANLKALESAEMETAGKNWLLTGNTQLNEKIKGDQGIEELANNTISFLCTYLKANIGAIYQFNVNENALMLSGQYAFLSPKDTKEKFMLNEGLIGQAAREKKQISLTGITDEHLRITSSVMNAKLKNLLITPFLFEGKTMGVTEIGRLTDFSKTEKEFISASMGSIGISVNSAIGKKNLEKLNSQLKGKEQQLSNQINAINRSNASIEFDLNGTILGANENFLILLGYTEKEILGKHHSIFVEKSYAASKEYLQFWDTLKKGEFQQDVFKRIHKNGDTVWLQGSYNPILDTAGNPVKILKIATDITLARNQELELAQQAGEMEKRAAELVIANKELVYQNDEKEKRAAELVIANKELVYQNDEKGKRAAELVITNNELASQAEELQSQQEELKEMNEELEEQSKNLKQQQEELQITNEELEEQTQSLEEKNKEVEAGKYDLEQKTNQLVISSKYKSEFLANMSHELRTPLNSLLILSKDLSENRNNNLDISQVESAEIIYKSGQDLLKLINEVLDLSKIEAGKMSITIEKVSLKNFTDELIRDFKHQAKEKGLILTCKLDKELPESIRTDSQRLNQILKNLLSNAIKFTEKGSVSININQYTKNTLIIAVTDTGIGIAEEKQMAIFEAFQQAEGGTSRKYGGTGLGLSISLELAKLLGAEIKLSSSINEGSTFSVLIPLEIHHENEPVRTGTIKEPILYNPRAESDSEFLNYPTIADDRDSITGDDKVVLIIEDDLNFASILLKQTNKKGFKCLSAATGEDGLLLAAKYKPQAIILDMGLPGINGHRVMLELKANPAVRHIPVHIISAHENSLEPIKEGAVAYLMKPINKKDLEDAFNSIESFVSRKIKNLLIIEDSEDSRKAMRKLIGNGDVKCFEAGTGKEALLLYQQHQIDCIILDIGLPDMSGFDLIHKLENKKTHSIPPIIVYTGKELTKEENAELQKYAETIIIKGAKSEERLLDETALFLHRTISNLPKSQQLIINNLYDKEAVFQTKKILVVDDDMRNVFALSKILKERGMEVLKAENGKNALEILDLHPDINLVLMDIMMPEMDGYEAMKRIRSHGKFKTLPVIALTAKAMKDDKQKCIDAGANDYLTKPIEIQRLLSLMRVWLSK